MREGKIWWRRFTLVEVAIVVINIYTNNMQANIKTLPCQQALPQPGQAAGAVSRELRQTQDLPTMRRSSGT